MRSRLIRALVNALGERGDISLPVVPQLQPVVDVGSMDRIGYPIGLPVQISTSSAASPAERSGILYRAPEGFIIRIDRVRADTVGGFALIYGRRPADVGSNQPWIIVDPRASNSGLLGVLYGPFAAQRSLAALQTPIAAGQAAYVTGVMPTAQWVEGPWYVDSEFGLGIAGQTDNTLAWCFAVGEAFETG